ncbi:hypothetical protein ACOMHN_017318 [Nucella lapillus]
MLNVKNKVWKVLNGASIFWLSRCAAVTRIGMEVGTQTELTSILTGDDSDVDVGPLGSIGSLEVFRHSMPGSSPSLSAQLETPDAAPCAPTPPPAPRQQHRAVSTPGEKNTQPERISSPWLSPPFRSLVPGPIPETSLELSTQGTTEQLSPVALAHSSPGPEGPAKHNWVQHVSAIAAFEKETCLVESVESRRQQQQQEQEAPLRPRRLARRPPERFESEDFRTAASVQWQEKERRKRAHQRRGH